MPEILILIPTVEDTHVCEKYDPPAFLAFFLLSLLLLKTGVDGGLFFISVLYNTMGFESGGSVKIEVR